MSTAVATIDFSRLGQHWEVIVIGAGPAGAIAAGELSKHGKKVLLLDKATFPRYKVCGCCLSESAISILAQCQLQGILPALNAVPLKELRLFTGPSQASLPLSGAFALSRQNFDCALIDAAITSGADFSPRTSAYVQELANDSRAIELVQDGNSLKTSASCLVLADGLNGSSLKKSKLLAAHVAHNSRLGAGTVACDFPENFYTKGVIYMACGKGGYAGLVRLENGLLDIACALDADFIRQQGGPGMAAQHLLSSASLPTIPNLAQLDWHGTPPLTRSRAVSADRIFATGDSASYAEPFTGEGMAWAMASGRAVVPFVLKVLSGQEKFAGSAWQKHHARLIASKQRTTLILGRFLRQPQLVELSAKAINFMPSLAAPIVRHITKPVASEIALSNKL
jgi:menaquinone-9 beta-reductase